MVPRGAGGLFHPPPFWPKPDLPSTSCRSWPPGQRPCVLSLPGPLGMDCSGDRRPPSGKGQRQGRPGRQQEPHRGLCRHADPWGASNLTETDCGVAPRVSVPGVGGEGTWSLEQEGPEECQVSGLWAPSPSLRGLPSGGPGGAVLERRSAPSSWGPLGLRACPRRKGWHSGCNSAPDSTPTP